jgi:Tfp pilus assembly protein PilF
MSDGRLQQAIDDLTQAVTLDPLDALAYINLASVYFATGDPDRGQQALSEAIAIGDPQAMRLALQLRAQVDGTGENR